MVELLVEKFLFFALGILFSTAGAGWTFGRTLAVLGVRIEHLEKAVATLTRKLDKEVGE